MVGYIPGLAMRRIADLHPGEAKTDARDAAIIAEASRSLPHTLPSIVLADEQAAELSILCGFDDDLAKQATATSNRIRGLLTQIHPALERVVGKHLDHPAMAELLIKSLPRTSCAKLARPGLQLCCRGTRHGPGRAGRERCSLRWLSRPSWLPARTPLVRSCRSSRRCPSSCAHPGTRCLTRSNPSWRSTLFTSS